MDNNIGQTILSQLGGGRFLAMTGAKPLLLENGLQVKMTIGKLSCVTVELDGATDTYTVQGFKGRGINIKPVGEPFTDVYADNLRRLFTGMTGLEVML